MIHQHLKNKTKKQKKQQKNHKHRPTSDLLRTIFKKTKITTRNPSTKTLRFSRIFCCRPKMLKNQFRLGGTDHLRPPPKVIQLNGPMRSLETQGPSPSWESAWWDFFVSHVKKYAQVKLGGNLPQFSG